MDIVPEAGEQDECLNGVFLSAEQDAPGDGHVKFYTKKEYEKFLAESGRQWEKDVSLYNADGEYFCCSHIKFPVCFISVHVLQCNT